MTDEEKLRIFKSHVAPPKFVERKWLQEHVRHRQNGNTYYSPCPICGTDDHCLCEAPPYFENDKENPYVVRGPFRALVTHCHVSGKMLLIKEMDILGVIEKEEKEFAALLDRWHGKIPERLTPEEAFTLRTQEGVPEAILETKVEDTDKFYLLLKGHRQKSGNVFRKEIFGGEDAGP